MKRPADVKLSREDGDALIARIKANELSEGDRWLVVKLIELWFWLSFALNEAKLSVKWLKCLLFGRGRGSDDDDSGDASGSEAAPGAPADQMTPLPETPSPP